MNELDYTSFRIDRGSGVQKKPSQEWTKPPSHRIKGAFLKGPVSMCWLRVAGRLPGKALAIAVIVHYFAGLRKTVTNIRLNSEELRHFGISRFSTYRALQKLENAGLVTVVRKRGRLPLINIIEVFN